MADENIDVRVRLKERARFKKDTRGAADDVDHLGDKIDRLGDKAKKSTRELGALGVKSSATRVNLGVFSTTTRGATLAVGGLANATGGLIPLVLSGAEAVAVLAGGGAAAGGVGVLGLVQALGVGKLALGGFMEALGGSEEAARKLSPELRVLLSQLRGAQEQLQDTAQDGMMPGLEQGIASAMRNLPVLDRIVAKTADTLGGLAADAGGMLGSGEWGRDLGTLGAANVEIIDDLGHAGLFLADALKDVAVEAAPLAKWLASEALSGSRGVAAWTERARASGDMARFFREARTDLMLLGSATGHGSRGLINLFGAQDVDGTRTLRNLDAILARFERWTASDALKDGLGDAIIDEIPDAVGAATSALARALPGAGATAARMFAEGFIESDVWGKLLLGGALAHKLGLFKKLGKKTGGGGALGAAGGAPVPVIVMNPGFGMPGTPGSPTPVPGEKPGKKPQSRASRGAQVAGWGAIPFAPDIVRAIMGEGNFNQYSGSQGFAELGRDIRARVSGLSTGPMSRPSQANLNPGSDPMRRVIEVVAPVVTLDGEKVGRLNAQVLERRQARN